MNIEPHDRSLKTKPRARVIAAQAESEALARRMELTFLATAMAVFIVTSGLVMSALLAVSFG